MTSTEMESAYFYNVFFSEVQKPVQDIMENIKALPDDIISYMGHYFDVKITEDRRRITRLNEKMEDLHRRSVEDWVSRFITNPSQGRFSNTTIVKVCKKTIKVMEGDTLRNFTPEKIRMYCRENHLSKKDDFIYGIIKRFLTRIRFTVEGQTIVTPDGNMYRAQMTMGGGSKRLTNGEWVPYQGCNNLYWTRT